MAETNDGVRITLDGIELEGSLRIPHAASGLVLFAHGSGSSRHSPRNNFVADQLRAAGLATLLMDLLTEQEDEIYETRFDIELLTERLLAATRWLAGRDDAKGLDVGYFGSSTGAAAALLAATQEPTIGAVVSRGGRPDLAEELLDRVRAPTLLIVGGDDTIVIGFNRSAYDRLETEKELTIVPGAGHLFEGPGQLEEVSSLAAEWFRRHLGSSASR